MNCSKCGAEISDSMSFCINCGSPIVKNAQSSLITPDSQNSSTIQGNIPPAKISENNQQSGYGYMPPNNQNYNQGYMPQGQQPPQGYMPPGQFPQNQGYMPPMQQNYGYGFAPKAQESQDQGYSSASLQYGPQYGYKKKKGNGCLIFAVSIIVIIAAIYFIPGLIPGLGKDPAGKVKSGTYNASKTFEEATILTHKVLHTGPDDIDYNTWSSSAKEAMDMWQRLEKQSTELEKWADALIKEQESGKKASLDKNKYALLDRAAAEFSNMLYGYEAYGYTKQEVTDVFDNAPPGQKIKTLAKHLGVDAKRAYQILKMTNEQIKAEAWNNAGDTFEKLENGARAIKSGCKVTGYVGGMILSGGSLSAMNILEAGAVIVQGADLVLEVSEDMSYIAAGYNNDFAALVGKARKVTEPAAGIVGLFSLGGDDIDDLVNGLCFNIDMASSMIQEKKLLGIQIDKKGNKPVAKTAVLKQNEVKDYLKKENISTGELKGKYADMTLKLEKTQIANKTEQKDEKTADSGKTTQPAAKPNNTAAGSGSDKVTDEQEFKSILAGTWRPYGKTESKGDGVWFHINEVKSNTSELLYIFDNSGGYRTVMSYDNVKREYKDQRDKEIQDGIDEFQKKIDKKREISGNYYYEKSEVKKNQKWAVNGRNEQGDIEMVYLRIGSKIKTLDGKEMEQKLLYTLVNKKWLISAAGGEVYVK